MTICEKLENQIFTHKKFGSGIMSRCRWTFSSLYAIVQFEDRIIDVDILFCIRYHIGLVEGKELQEELARIVDKKKHEYFNSFHCPSWRWDDMQNMRKIFENENETVYIDVELTLGMINWMRRQKLGGEWYLEE